jgi:hypothetical protein
MSFAVISIRRAASRLLLLVLLCSVAFAPPAAAGWLCAIDQRYSCATGTCTLNAGGAVVRIDEKLLSYQHCSPDCEKLAVTLKRSFFGSRYEREDGGLPALVALRSRSGEYSEARFSATGAVTALAYGTCRWE